MADQLSTFDLWYITEQTKLGHLDEFLLNAGEINRLTCVSFWTIYEMKWKQNLMFNNNIVNGQS